MSGFSFGEGPRWRDNALYFSDMHGHRVVRLTLDGKSETVAEVKHDEPSGLGWLPDGRLLVVAMETQKLLRVEKDGSLSEHADLSGLARGSINDMIVRADGTAYIGDMGARIHDPNAVRHPGQTIRVSPDGKVSCAADNLASPNGHILTSDEKTLLVAESGGSRLTAFDVAADGTLSNQRLYAELKPSKPGVSFAPPDGVCLDAEGAVWVADPINAVVTRVKEGGQVTDMISFTDVIPIACVLGGPDRRTLLICVSADWKLEVVTRSPTARIEAIEVAVPGAGKP